MDLAGHGDISWNRGPESNHEITSRSVGLYHYHIDLLALTERWLRPGNIDCVEIDDLCPTGYAFIYIPRESRGGGVGLLFKGGLAIKWKNSAWNTFFQSFEILDARVESSKIMRMIIIYTVICAFANIFSWIFSPALGNGHCIRRVLIYTLHGCSRYVNAVHFCDSIASFDLKQWVTT